MTALKESFKKNVQEMNIEEIIDYRDTFDIHSEEWRTLNLIKADWLEEKKPSTKESIIYFDKATVETVPMGFSPIESLPEFPYSVAKRSVLEYHSEQRHPIPYAVIRHQNKYFFILRESESGEIRLIGKKGMLGGHVGEEDIDTSSLNASILNALKRELHEEAGITDDMVEQAMVKGFIKSNEGVDNDHLGIVYEITLNTDAIKSEEEGKLSGIWIQEEELRDHYGSFESWSKIVYDELLKKSRN